jgi:hypothetical protein
MGHGNTSDDDNSVPSKKRPTPRRSSTYPPGKLSGNFSKHKLGITVGGGGGGRRKIKNL